MAIRVDDELIEHIKQSFGWFDVEVRDSNDEQQTIAGLDRALYYLYRIPHPEQPDDPFPSCASGVEVGATGVSFWADMSGAEECEGVVERAVQAVLTGLAEAGVTEGVVTWPGSDPERTSVWDPDKHDRFIDDWDERLSELRDPPLDELSAKSPQTPAPLEVASSAWSTHASLATKRADVGAVCGPDGRIYAIGGEARAPLKTVEVYDPSVDRWRRAASLHIARRGPGVAVGSDGRLYAIGGFDSERNERTTVEAYDPSSNSWEIVAPVNYNGAGEMSACTGADGRIYAVGHRAFETYDVDSDTWTSLTSSGFIPFALAPSPDGRIFAFGWDPSNRGMASVKAYDSTLDRWADVSPPTEQRVVFGVALGRDGRIFAIGGVRPKGERVSAVDAYDPGADRWDSMAPLPAPGGRMSVATGLDGRLFAIGGFELPGSRELVAPVYSYLPP